MSCFFEWWKQVLKVIKSDRNVPQYDEILINFLRKYATAIT